MAPTLTTDQRWLMWAIGGWQMRDCLLSPAGVDHFMTSMSSVASGTALNGCPSWLTGWNTQNRKITAPWQGEVRVVLTAAQINAYARQIPAHVLAELQECRTADRAEQIRTDEWCYCPSANEAPNAHSGPCRRYHPTDDEEQAHFDIGDSIAERLDQTLWTALGLGSDNDQLDLFTESGQLALF